MECKTRYLIGDIADTVLISAFIVLAFPVTVPLGLAGRFDIIEDWTWRLFGKRIEEWKLCRELTERGI